MHSEWDKELTENGILIIESMQYYLNTHTHTYLNTCKRAGVTQKVSKLRGTMATAIVNNSQWTKVHITADLSEFLFWLVRSSLKPEQNHSKLLQVLLLLDLITNESKSNWSSKPVKVQTYRSCKLGFNQVDKNVPVFSTFLGRAVLKRGIQWRLFSFSFRTLMISALGTFLYAYFLHSIANCFQFLACFLFFSSFFSVSVTSSTVAAIVIRHPHKVYT